MILEKRAGLVDLIREQTLGPGAMRSRFVDKRDIAAMPRRVTEKYDSELLNRVPAGFYSTGILFPEDHTKGMEKDEADEEDDTDEMADGGKVDVKGTVIDAAPNSQDEDDPDDPGEEEELVNIDAQSLNQMYPNTMGLTVCLDSRVLDDRDLEIFVSGRYYTKEPAKTITADIGVSLEQDRSVFQALLDSLPPGDSLKEAIGIDDLDAQSNYLFLRTKTIPTDQLKKRVYDIKRERAARFTFKNGKTANNLDPIKQAFFDDLRRSVLPGSEEGMELAARIREIEALENSLSHILDLLSLHDEMGYGLWRCESFRVRVGEDLEIPRQVKGKKIYSYKRYDELANVFQREYAGTKDKQASLSVNLQYSKFAHLQKDADRLYLKVQLKNSSTPFCKKDTKNGKNYFSMASEEINSRCFFGVAIEVSSRYLSPTRSFATDIKDTYNEDDVSRYTYRQFADLGLGHGCSVRWGQEGERRFVRTEYIPTQDVPDVDTIPRYRSQFSVRTNDGYVPRPVFPNDQFLQFKWLSSLSRTDDEAIVQAMSAFVGAYGDWVEEQKDPDNPAIVQQIQASCRQDQERMLRNVSILRTDKKALYCFRLMNTAMFMQLWHSVRAKGDTVDRMMDAADFDGFTLDFYTEKATDDLFPGIPHAAWRPFQLAFILLNLDGIFQPADDKQWTCRNDLVDLVWFPTGGGKTEAYLGLIALTIIHRRRTFKDLGGGTAVMMRYTLRLLTTQQFQRATLLIMALELIRRWGKDDLGKEPIYVGLFVGKKNLWKNLDEMKKDLMELRSAQEKGRKGKTKLPILKCPWCGHPIDPINPREGKGDFFEQRVLIECCRPGYRCAFATAYPESYKDRLDQGPLPVSLCDEEIYLHPPALLFGTVDKFAQLAHKVADKKDKRLGDSRRLFGNRDSNWETYKPKNGYRPPELIIQDELHLMMGPLGSAVALFESAIDQLCTREANGRCRPKVISSTATTRNTSLQIMALFDRKVNIFPKPGVHCDDSFFALYKRTAKDDQGNGMQYGSKRQYMGILPTGRTQTWMQLRLAAILFTHRALFEYEKLRPGDPFDPVNYPAQLAEAMDNYHTVLAYFNSLREVGKTQSQIYSYLVKEIRRVFNIVVRPNMAMQCFYTYDHCFHDSELTGRLSGEEAIENMSRIGVKWSPVERLAHHSDKKIEKGTTPPDFVIATNMISVGVDIPRFNTMIINCMPRNIAEYIQASSRVARDKPGLVITVHHPFRSRDLSHYERFIEFHEKMYSYVEPISITPFTHKALERYLPLYVATIIRHQGFADRSSANKAMDAFEIEHWIKRLVGYFQKRMVRLHAMTDIDPVIKRLLEDDNIDRITRLVREALEIWRQEYEKAQEEKRTLVFNNQTDRRPERQLYVDIDEYQDNINSGMWRIPQSLRVVDPEAVVHVKQK